MSDYTYTVDGYDRDRRTWLVEGELQAERGMFPKIAERIIIAAFDHLTNGTATYGEPGKTCRGPYVVRRMTIILKESAAELTAEGLRVQRGD